MTAIVLIILAVILGIIGIIGSIVPGLPGPPVSWIGMLLAFLARRLNNSDNEITTSCLLIWLAIMVVVSILDYVIPSKFTKLAGGSKSGSRGATIGMIIGMFATPLGMIPCSLIGAFLAEWLQEDKPVSAAIKAALGTFAGFLAGTGLKLISATCMMYYILF